MNRKDIIEELIEAEYGELVGQFPTKEQVIKQSGNAWDFTRYFEENIKLTMHKMFNAGTSLKK